MTREQFPSSALALYPTRSGIAFVFFERPGLPLDWGVHTDRRPVSERNAGCLERIETLIGRYQPEVIVTEDWTERPSRRSKRVQRLYRSVLHLAVTHAIEFERYGKEDIRATFESVGARTRVEIAQAVAREIPAFAHRVPGKRKIWQREPVGMALFSAAAVGLTFYSARTDACS